MDFQHYRVVIGEAAEVIWGGDSLFVNDSVFFYLRGKLFYLCLLMKIKVFLLSLLFFFSCNSFDTDNSGIATDSSLITDNRYNNTAELRPQGTRLDTLENGLILEKNRRPIYSTRGYGLHRRWIVFFMSNSKRGKNRVFFLLARRRCLLYIPFFIICC